MAGLSEVKICNLALNKLGAARISTRDEASAEAQACDSIYDEVRDDVLADHIWNFAQKRAALGLLDETPEFTDDGVNLVYQAPTDMIKLNFVNIESAIVKLEGDKILSDTAGLELKYTRRVTDVQKFFPKFVEALATRLAAELAFTLTASRSLSSDLFTSYYSKKLPDAISADSQQGTAVGMFQDEWILARVQGGASSIGGRSGASTWFPCGGV